nr:putative reverse transcriptase domain-containing protein [Tanacetum cinerariifolium]
MGSTYVVKEEGRFILNVHKLSRVRQADHQESPQDRRLPKEYHEVHLKIVLELLKKKKLFAKFSKCEFWLQEVHFFEHVFNTNGVHVDPSKIEAVKYWKVPKTPFEIRAEDFVVYCDALNQGLRRKVNVVADALSRKERVKPKRVRGMSMMIQSSIKEKFLVAQNEVTKKENVPAEMLRGMGQQMEKKGYRGLYFMDRIWVPLIGDVRTMIMDEVHNTRYFIHPGAGNMYYDFRDMYRWASMKKDIATYVSKCLTCSKVKDEHQRPPGLSQQLKIPEWK